MSETSLTRSAWRLVPVLAKMRLRWVFKVFSPIPRDNAVLDAVNPLPIRRRTRASAGVRSNSVVRTASGSGEEDVVVDTKTAAHAGRKTARAVPSVNGKTYATAGG